MEKKSYVNIHSVLQPTKASTATSIPTESCSVALTLQSQSLLLILCSGFFLYNSQELVTDAFRWQTK